MKTKIIGIIVGILLITSSGLTLAVTINIKPLNNNSKFNDFFNPNPINVFIDLDINGIAYGHELLWKANTTGTNYEESAVTYVDGVAYIGSCSTHGQGHDKLFAVDVTNGEILWSYPTGPGYVGPVIDGDVVYIGTDFHTSAPADVYAINRHNGDLIWNKTIPGGIAESIQFDDNKIYFCSSEEYSKIYALNKIDGSINWTYYVDLFYSANKPMLKDNAFYAAYFHPGGKLYKLNATDGSIIWTTVLSNGPWDNSITADGEGRIFLAIYGDSTMNAYSEIDGSLLWSYPLHGPSLSFNAYRNGKVFVADTAGYVYAFNSTTGNLVWENKIGDTIDISSPTLSGGLIFIGTRDFDESALFALNETNGDILWKHTIGTNVTAPPSIADGMMFCGSDGWYMYAYDIGVGNGDWTLHRYDSWNTAYSPNGLTTWQYVEADCSTNMDITTCTITNNYDHDVNDIILNLDFSAYWYDSQGNWLKSNSDNYTIDSLSSLYSITYLISKKPLGPYAPSIKGETNGKVGTSYKYSFTSIDYEGDDISEYIINWDDGSEEETILGPFKSGSPATTRHIWNKKGTYFITAKAKDINGFTGPNGTFKINMPRTRAWLRFIDMFPILQRLWDFIK